MPVRSLNSAVLKWPGPDEVIPALRVWARRIAWDRPLVRAVGCFGSYASGEWGVGSDADLLVLLSKSDVPFERRGLAFDASGLPVPAEVLVYTEEEWRRMKESGSRFAGTVEAEAVWLYRR